MSPFFFIVAASLAEEIAGFMNVNKVLVRLALAQALVMVFLLDRRLGSLGGVGCVAYFCSRFIYFALQSEIPIVAYSRAYMQQRRGAVGYLAHCETCMFAWLMIAHSAMAAVLTIFSGPKDIWRLVFWPDSQPVFPVLADTFWMKCVMIPLYCYVTIAAIVGGWLCAKEVVDDHQPGEAGEN